MSGLDRQAVPAVEQADFLLTVGLFDEADPLERYDRLFAGARARDLPMSVNSSLLLWIWVRRRAICRWSASIRIW